MACRDSTLRGRCKRQCVDALTGPAKISVMASPLSLLGQRTREPIRRWVLGAFPRNGGGSVDYDQPIGDPGLFDPAGATWRIHADFAGMLSGGLAALMLQTLHPLALAGVWDHSSFRTDLVGRLRRTTTFVGGTTYAPTEAANALIARVRAIHDQVHGHAEDGRRYDANDPDLLTWVHVTEAYSFLHGYRRFSHADMPTDAGDRYYAENARIAVALGARHVPQSEAQVADYFANVRPELAYNERSRIVLGILSKVRLPVPAAGLSRDLFLHAGMDLLPAWARTQLGYDSPLQRTRSAIAARTLWAMAPMFRMALTDGIVAHSCRRVGMDQAQLASWPR